MENAGLSRWRRCRVSRTALDDEQARGLSLRLLGKGAVFAQRFERSLTAELDEERERLLQVQLAGRRLDP